MPISRDQLRGVHRRIPGLIEILLIRDPNGPNHGTTYPAVGNTGKAITTQRQLALAGLGTEARAVTFKIHDDDLPEGVEPQNGDWVVEPTDEVESGFRYWSIVSNVRHLLETRWDCIATLLTDNRAGVAPSVPASDTTNPTANIEAVTSPTNAAVAELDITFSEAVSGFTLGSLSLTRDGGAELLTGSETLTSNAAGTVWTLAGLAALAAAEGTYTLTLTAAGSGIEDAAGNALLSNVSRSWTVDTTAPTASILAVAPDPRDTAVASIVIQFSEPVEGFTLASLTLTRSGGADLLTGDEMLTTGDDLTWSLTGIAALTGSAGTYLLTLDPDGITDAAGNELAAGATESWTYSAAPPPDVTIPTATITPVSPDPHETSVNAITIVFSEVVTNVNRSDFTLTRDGGANLLTAAQTLTTFDSQVYSLGNLAGLTATAGTYLLTLVAAGSGIQDAAGNLLAANATETWECDPGPTWPALRPSDRMLGHLGANGFDVGVNGSQTYAIAGANWYPDWWILYYTYRVTVRTTGFELQFDGQVSSNTLPRRVSDPLTGQPSGPATFNGTLARIEAQRPGSSKGWYTTLMRVRHPDANYNAGAWPLNSATLDAGYLPHWLNPLYNDPGDKWFGGESGVAYKDAACRTHHGREWARAVAAMMDLHPTVDTVFSDNFSDNTIGDFDYAAECLLAKTALDSLEQEFGKTICLHTNTTSKWTRPLAFLGAGTDLRTNMDQAEDARIAGLITEGMGHAKFMLVADHNVFFQNLKYWLAKSWIGGGRRFFSSYSRNEFESGASPAENCLNRVLYATAASAAGNTIDITLSGPHYLNDTSLQRVAVSPNFHAGVAIGDNNWIVTPHISNPNRMTLHFGSPPPASGYGTGPAAAITFLYSGMDVDAAVLHSIRRPDDCCRVLWATGLQDSRGYVEPLWVDWAADHGFAVGDPERVVSADYTLAGNVWGNPCAGLTRTLFPGGEYLWIDWRRTGRRTWWGDSSGNPI